MKGSTISMVLIFVLYAIASYFAVGYAVDNSIMSAGRAAALSLTGYLVVQFIALKLTRKL